jgi:Tfp pilus assembly protein PilX
MRPAAEGFAMLALLALLAVVGLYVAGTFQDALFGATLSSARIHQQRAFELADIGIEQAMQALGAAAAPADFVHVLHPLPGTDDAVTVELHAAASGPVTAGYSMRRLVARRYEITSTATAARGARSIQVQGVVRLAPLAVPAP